MPASPVATIGSEFRGYCDACHESVTGKMITGEAYFGIDDKYICVTGSIGQGSCGHTCHAIGMSRVLLINGLNVAREGDPVEGTISGEITSGNPWLSIE